MKVLVHHFETKKKHFMLFQNPKAVTIKLPRSPITPVAKNHMLDIALACACPGIHDGANYADRKEFEHYIMTSSDSEICQMIKEALANLSEEERSLLFR